MNTLRILAFDPGTTASGWCRLNAMWGLGQPVTVSYQEAAHVKNTLATFRALIEAPGIDLIAIEKPEAYAWKRKGKDGYGSKMVGHLMASDAVASEIATVARIAGKAVEEITAIRVRRLICGGNGSTKDAVVKVAVMRLVAGWPSRSNAHMRDAGACGLAAAWLAASRKGGKAPV